MKYLLRSFHITKCLIAGWYLSSSVIIQSPIKKNFPIVTIIFILNIAN